MEQPYPFYFPIEKPEGWFFSNNDFSRFQKVNNLIYVYVLPHAFGRWVVQAYYRSNVVSCELEARVHVDEENNYDFDEVRKLFELGDYWLNQYGNDISNLITDPYCPWNKNGWRGNDITGKTLEY